MRRQVDAPLVRRRPAAEEGDCRRATACRGELRLVGPEVSPSWSVPASVGMGDGGGEMEGNPSGSVEHASPRNGHPVPRCRNTMSHVPVRGSPPLPPPEGRRRRRHSAPRSRVVRGSEAAHPCANGNCTARHRRAKREHRDAPLPTRALCRFDAARPRLARSGKSSPLARWAAAGSAVDKAVPSRRACSVRRDPLAG